MFERGDGGTVSRVGVGGLRSQLVASSHPRLHAPAERDGGRGERQRGGSGTRSGTRTGARRRRTAHHRRRRTTPAAGGDGRAEGGRTTVGTADRDGTRIATDS